MVTAEQYAAQLEKQVEEMEKQQQGVQVNQAVQGLFDSDQNDNLVKWQLSIQAELDAIEHLLRGHIVVVDEKGNERYDDPPEGDKVLNDYGVNQILHLLNWYLTKNIILSNFDDKQIDQRLEQLGDVLTDFVYCNYEKMGLDKDYKRKQVPLIIMNVVNTIEASYNRAYKGGERESLRSARSVVQSEQIGARYPQNNFAQPQRKVSMFRPSTWFGR